LTVFRWRIQPGIPADHPLCRQNISSLVKQLLYNRGISSPEAAEAFLSASVDLLCDEWGLPDIDKAVSRISTAISHSEPIAVYGDFDVDGISATALLVEGLTELGAVVEPYIPHRIQEGHGLNSFALNELQEHGIKLVITVDCGITGVGQIEKLRRGMDVVITDHHLPGTELPDAIAVIDPHRSDSVYPCNYLAGVGVAFKLLSALYDNFGLKDRVYTFLDLVALGTVADMVPLIGENRFLVASGLKQLRYGRRPGIVELLNQSGITPENIEAEHISWIIAPRLNAAGRMEHANPGYRLLVTRSAVEAGALSQWLNEKNVERQKLTAAAFAHAREQVISRGISPLLIASHTDYPGGILGLVAGRLVDEFYHPAVVISIGEEISHGSSRSTPGFNINEAMCQCAELLSHFGGHAQAAGFTLPTSNLAALEEKLAAIAEREIGDMDLRPQLDIDAQVKFHELGGSTYKLIQSIAPFGQGNPQPSFLSRGVMVTDYRQMGAGGQHLRLRLKQNNILWEGVAFGLGERTIEEKIPLDIVYNLEHDDWNGYSRLRLNLKDFAPTGMNI
jgi:single-stranded-DNA-specific exonuclease